MTRLTILLLAMFLLTGCGSDTSAPEPQRILEVHLQTWFADTPVRVEVNEMPVLDARITTGSILAFAAIVRVHVDDGRHLLEVKADDITGVIETVVPDTSYIGVCYNATEHHLTFIPSKRPFAYR